jgi:hypothetical protein
MRKLKPPLLSVLITNIIMFLSHIIFLVKILEEIKAQFHLERRLELLQNLRLMNLVEQAIFSWFVHQK